MRKINRCSGRLEYLGSLKDRANFGPIEVERPLKTSAQEKNSAREARAGARQSGEKPFDPPGHGLSFGCSHDKSHSLDGRLARLADVEHSSSEIVLEIHAMKLVRRLQDNLTFRDCGDVHVIEPC